MSTWDDLRVKLLTQLHGEGLSATQISIRIFGSSEGRSRVCGKLHRMGLTNVRRATNRDRRHIKPQHYFGRPSGASPEQIAAKKEQRYALAAQLLEQWPEGDGLPLTSLRAGDGRCRFPLSSVAGTVFCGHAATRGAYCADHGAVAYIGPKLASAA